MTAFSTFTIEALVQVISGGSGMNNPEPPIGNYRSASDINGFLTAVDRRGMLGLNHVWMYMDPA